MKYITGYRYNVGDTAFGGTIVLKTDNGNGTKKLIIARNGVAGGANASIGMVSWSPMSAYDFDITRERDTSGKLNTAKILSLDTGATVTNSAAALATAFSENGYDDWFLPSFYELAAAHPYFKGTPYIQVWSSCEWYTNKAATYWTDPAQGAGTMFRYKETVSVIPFREQIISDDDDNIYLSTSNYFYLAGNPIEISIGTGNSIRYRVYGGTNYDTILYVGMAYTIDGGSATIDISELFSAMKNTSGVQKVRIVKVDDDGNNWVGDADYIHKHDITIFGGGISNLYKRFLATAETNIFDFKLKNQETNFFLTTRTNDYIITIPEDELLPLYYYGSGMAFTVKNGDDVLAVYDHTSETDEVLHSIDFNQLRKLAVAELGRLVNYFRLTTANGWACSVLITNVDQPSGCFLIFKNSWGCDEKIGVKGIVKYTPSITESSKIKRQDSTTREFKTINQRTTYTNVYKLDVGYRTYEERMFLVDMLVTGIARIEINGMQLTVNIASSTEELAGTDFNPRNVELKISLQDTESMYSPINLETMYNVLTSGGADVEADGSKILV